MTPLLTLTATIGAAVILGLLLLVVAIARNMDNGKSALGRAQPSTSTDAAKTSEPSEAGPMLKRILEQASRADAPAPPTGKSATTKSTATAVAIIGAALAMLLGVAIAFDNESEGRRTEQSADD